MQIQVEIVSVTETQMPKYKKLEVAYKQDGKIQGKNLVSYAHPGVYALAKELKVGEVVNVTMEKENGYWQWVAISSSGAASYPKATEVAGAAAVPQEKAKTVSNYETKEERAVRQQYIIRQSCIERAIDFWNMHNKKATEEEVLTVASSFVAWVNNDSAGAE